MLHVLFADDDADVQKAAALLLSRRGFRLSAARSLDDAWSVLAAEPVDVVLLDLNFAPGATTGAEGLEFLRALLAHDPDQAVVVVTGHSGITVAVAAMRAGAVDFVMKPWSNARLVTTLTEAAAVGEGRRRREPAVAGRTAAADERPVLGDGPAMRRLLEVTRRAAATDAPVLLIGAPGTGKSLMATMIHRLSPRAQAPLHVLDLPTLQECGPDWTATAARIAAEDTVVLDEVAALGPSMQAQLLAWLRAHPGPRLISCSREPRAALATRLPTDLLYRLGVVELALPPLADRGDDVRQLALHFLRLHGHRYGRTGLSFTDAALDTLAAAPWPGNVRELSQIVERAVVLAPRDEIGPQDIPLPVQRPDGVAAPAAGEGDLNLARSERAVVEAALRRHGFNVSQAARELGVTRATLYRRMARHGL